MVKKLCVILTDPIKAYFEKGEIKKRYYNPGDFFDEVHLISFCDRDIDEQKVSMIAGRARLQMHPIGPVSIKSIFTIENRLAKLIESIRPDILRAYDSSIRGYLSVRLARKFSIPSVISIHTDYDEDRKYSKNFFKILRLSFEKYSLRNSSKVICVSDHVAGYAQRRGARDIKVIYNRVYTGQFNRSPRKESENKRKAILCVGRLDQPKRQEIIIEAVKDLDVRLVLIGNGPNKPKLKRLAARLCIENKVDFIDAVPNNKIQEYYSMADIFAIATDHEGFCIPVLEAMAASLPVVASDIPVIGEILKDTGILVKNTSFCFKSAIKQLLDRSDTALNKGMLARDRALTLDGDIMEEKEKGLYENLMFLK